MSPMHRLTLLIFLISAFMTACGPATPSPVDDEVAGTDTTNVASSEANNGAEVADAVVEAESSEETLASNAENLDPPAATGAGEATVEVKPTVASAPPDDSLIQIDTDSLETNDDGITVGFTLDGNPFIGDPDAPVVIEEYSDYECPYCLRWHRETYPTLLEEQIATGQLILVYLDFPLSSIHPRAVIAAVAANCAGRQGANAYWDMHQAIFDSSGQWSNSLAADFFKGLASELNLDEESFNACIDDGDTLDSVQVDFQEGRSLGISSTPSFFLNGQALIGAQPLAVFNQAIARVQSGQPIASDTAGSSAPAPSQPPVAPTPATISLDNYAFAYGDPDAAVTIIEFTDYQCPYCQQHAGATLPLLFEEFIDTGRVYYVVKDLPLESIHPAARAGQNAARCAGEQDLYTEMHDALFEQQSRWSQAPDVDASLVELAGEIGADADSFATCMSERRYDHLVEENMQEAFSLGARGTPFFFVNGYPLSGARPIEHFQLAVDLAEKGTLAEAFVPQATPTPPALVLPNTDPVDVNLEGAGATFGDPDAPVTIVEFTDLQCPYCNQHHQEAFEQILSQYVDTGDVYYVIKDFPLTRIHPQAFIASEAAHCAGEEGAYADMADLMFDNQSAWSGSPNAVAIFAQFAGSLGLDVEAFQECVDSSRYEQLVGTNLNEGIELGITGTPTFFINGIKLTGAQPFSAFSQAIEQAKSRLE